MNKYGAKKTDCGRGHVHDSKREAKHCGDLHMLARGGAIINLEIQKQFYFIIDGKPLKLANGRRAGMKVDFFYTDAETLQDCADDAKGFTVRDYPLRDYPLRAALFRHCFPDIEFREV